MRVLLLPALAVLSATSASAGQVVYPPEGNDCESSNSHATNGQAVLWSLGRDDAPAGREFEPTRADATPAR